MEAMRTKMPRPNMAPKLGGLDEDSSFLGSDGGFDSSDSDGGRFSFISRGMVVQCILFRPEQTSIEMRIIKPMPIRSANPHPSKTFRVV